MTTDECRDRPPSKYYWTLPIGAAPAYYTSHIQTLPGDNGKQFDVSPNEIVFSSRHSFYLPTVSDDIRPIAVLGGSGFSLPNFEGGNDILSEHGVYEQGETVVMLKTSSRTLTLDILVSGQDRDDFLQAKETLSYIFSHEHGTATDIRSGNLSGANAYTRYPSAYDVPNMFTLTRENIVDGVAVRRHIDVAVVTIAGDGDMGETSTSMRSTLKLYCPRSYFYGDEVSFDFEMQVADLDYQGLNLPTVDSLVISPAQPGLLENQFKYTGSARTGLRVAGVTGLIPFEGSVSFFGVCLIDTTATYGVQSHGHFLAHPAITWFVPTDRADSVWKTSLPVLAFDLNADAMTLDPPWSGSERYADMLLMEDWSRLTLIPGHIYRVVVYQMCYDSAGEEAICGTFITDRKVSYIPRYAGI